MTDEIEKRLSAHFDRLAERALPIGFEARLLERVTPQRSQRRWVGMMIGIATAAVVFAVVAVPLFGRLGHGEAPRGGATSGSVRAAYLALVTTSSETLSGDLMTAQRVCPPPSSPSIPSRQTPGCDTAIASLSRELIGLTDALNNIAVPGGIAPQMAQLVQALNAFSTASTFNQPLPADTVLADGSSVEADLRTVLAALTGT